MDGNRLVPPPEKPIAAMAAQEGIAIQQRQPLAKGETIIIY